MAEFTVSKVETPDDYVRVHALFHEFLESVPLKVMFGVEEGCRNVEPRYGPEDFLIKAEDAEGNIVGFAANKFNATVVRDPDASPQRVELAELLEFVHNIAPLDRLPQRCIELRQLFVTNKWRGRGVAKKLAEESVVVSRAKGFSAIMICCVSEFTARLARSLGWKELYRLAYSDYPRLSGRSVQLKPNPPHDHAYYYYTEL